MRSKFTLQHRGGSGTPLVLLHGFTDTWRTWELVRAELEQTHDVLAPTLVGHAGGPLVPADFDDQTLADGVERAMDEAGLETAHIVGNSLGGYVAFQLAERGRARSVTALAPAGGWPLGDASYDHVYRVMHRMQRDLVLGAPLARFLSLFPRMRAQMLKEISVRSAHIPRELLIHFTHGARACSAARPMLAARDQIVWKIDPSKVTCPVTIVWGVEDRVLLYPAAASLYREWFPDATWIELNGVGHCPQLDVPDVVAALINQHTVEPSH